jgi:vacuolar-type H+-ATPase subunit H
MTDPQDLIAQLEDEADRRGAAARDAARRDREGTLTDADRAAIARDGLLPGHGYGTS